MPCIPFAEFACVINCFISITTYPTFKPAIFQHIISFSFYWNSGSHVVFSEAIQKILLISNKAAFSLDFVIL